MSRRRIVGVRAIAPQTEAPKEEKKPEAQENSVKQNFMDVLYYQAKQRDGLLGEFSTDGKYSIQNERILEALIDLPKILQELDNEKNIAYASTKIESVVINFKIEFELSESYCSAHLKIIEIEHKFDESIKHIQNLADHIDVYSPLFVGNVFKLWHVVKDATELDKRNFVVNYLDMQDRNRKFMRELSDILAQLYVMRMLQVLAGCGEVGEKIVAEYKLNLEKFLAQDPAFAQDNTRLKDLLDQIILKHKAFDIVIANGGSEVLKAFSDPINKLRGKEPEVVVSPAPASAEKKKEEKKSSSSKAANKKSDSKSASGGKSKSKSKSKGGGSAKKPSEKAASKSLTPLGINFGKNEIKKNLSKPTQAKKVEPVPTKPNVRKPVQVKNNFDAQDASLENALQGLDSGFDAEASSLNMVIEGSLVLDEAQEEIIESPINTLGRDL